MATPGPRKMHMRSDQGPLWTIWGHAGKAIDEADAIVIVGYSLPPTDSGTKDWLIQKLRTRLQRHLHERSERHSTWVARTHAHERMKSIPAVGPFVEKTIPVHVVLGPDRTTGHAERLVGLFKSVSLYFTVADWRVRAEDFLGLHKRHELLSVPAPIRGFVDVYSSFNEA